MDDDFEGYGNIRMRHDPEDGGRRRRRIVVIHFQADDDVRLSVAEIVRLYTEAQQAKGARKLTAEELIGAIAEKRLRPAMGGRFKFASCKAAPPLRTSPVADSEGGGNA